MMGFMVRLDLSHDYLPGHLFYDEKGEPWIRLRYIINGQNLAVKVGADSPAPVYLVRAKNELNNGKTSGRSQGPQKT